MRNSVIYGINIMECDIVYFSFLKFNHKYCSRKTSSGSEFIIILIENKYPSWFFASQKIIPY
jgi:hypothetical protein